MEFDYKRAAVHLVFIILLLSMLWLVSLGREVTGSAVYDFLEGRSVVESAFSAEPLSLMNGRFCFLIKNETGVHELTVVHDTGTQVFEGCDTYDFLIEFNTYDDFIATMSNPTSTSTSGRMVMVPGSTM